MTYQSYAPESASARRHDMVMLPPDLYTRRVTVDRAAYWINQSIPYAPARVEAAAATVSNLVTRRSGTEVDPVVETVNAMSSEQIDTAAQQLVDTATPTHQEFEAAARDQLAEVWAGMERADQIQLSSQPARLDQSYYTQLGS